VRDFGGGFIMAGGLRAFGDLGYKGTAVERVLPVTFQEQRPKKKRRTPIALFLLIDRSNSMGYNSKVRGLHDGQKMQYAQRAAIEVVNQLQDTDLAGGIAFDSEPFILAPLAPLAENRAELISKISRLQYGGGTDFYGALETAADQLARSRGTTRHIILITDGDSNRSPADHFPLVATIAQRQISITTIRIGDDTVNLQLLSHMSEKTGGRFYHVEDVEALPQLLVRDTKQAIREKEDEDDKPKEIKPRVGERGQILQGLDDFPALEEYMLTKPKNGADVQLYTDIHAEHDPILATWQYGLGKVVAVTFDPSGSGSSDWIRWDGFGKFWSQAVRWAIRDETPWDYRLSVQQRGERTVLQAESYDSDEEGILQVRLPRGTQSDELTLL
ncbi:MAG: VWA domain-containing protein, partial [Deltaproteobacteria bacterium]